MKRFLWAFVIMVLLGTAACQKKNGEVERIKFTPEDYNPTNRYFMNTEKGIYYYNETQKALRYFDFTSERDIYLCNKPECKHDGNAFCVATNARYAHKIHMLYNGKIVAPVIEETETQYLMKLLVISLDGTQLDEYATLLTVEKTIGIGKIEIVDAKLHRNKLLVVFKMSGEKNLEDAGYASAFLYDLDSGELTSLYEDLYGKDNPEIFEVKARDDYFYYYRQNGRKKKELYRYHITNKTEEECTPELSFNGDYFLPAEDTVLYLRRPRGFGIYHVTSKELTSAEFASVASMELTEKFSEHWGYWWERKKELQEALEEEPENKELQELLEKVEVAWNAYTNPSMSSLSPSGGFAQVWTALDDQYVYRLDKKGWHLFWNEEDMNTGEYRFHVFVEIYDQQCELYATINLADAFADTGCFDSLSIGDVFSESAGFHNILNDIKLYFSGETVFCILRENKVYRMNRREFLDGTAKAEYVCEINTR